MKKKDKLYTYEDMKSFADWCRNALLNTEYSYLKLDKHLEKWESLSETMKYEVLIKKSENDINNYYFKTINEICQFMELIENQVREKISWYESGLSKDFWYVNKYGIHYQIKKK
jgi:predicted RNA-binding protein with EMAP domain